MPFKPFLPPPPDCKAFYKSLKEAFADFPDDKKPLITTMDLTADVELVDCALGEVPKGCPLSYHFPLPSSQDYNICDDAPPQPALPLASNNLEPVDLSTLSAEAQERVNGMQITWEAAHHLELSTRKCKESVEEQQKMRLTYRFKDICKLQPGPIHANDLIYKLLKGPPQSKMAQIEEELKAEALREYCRHLCVNWYPCGLVVHPNAPWLGATPHGLVYDPKEQKHFGLVYVKCVMLPSFTDSNFLLTRNGALQLKRHHLCYWHIQGEMMVTGTPWCDLLVYSREDILVQRIYRDTALIKTMKEKLDEFFFSYFLQSLLTVQSK